MTKCLYIASPSFSGSTLLTLLLAKHPEIATIGEMKGGQEDLSTYECSCGELFKDCQFWNNLTDALKKNGFNYCLTDRNTMPVFHRSGSLLNDKILGRRFGAPWFEFARDLWLKIHPLCQKYLRHQYEFNRVFIEHILKVTGKKVFLDSSKDPIRIKYLSQIPSLEVYVVQLIRDGRAVVNSHRKNVGMSIAMAGREWRDTHSEIEKIAKKCAGGRLFQVRYEDLCADPPTHVNKIFKFASLSEEQTISTVDGSKLHVMGNRMRLKGFQKVRQDQGWKRSTPKKDLDSFYSIAGAMNRRFGYSE